MVLNNLQSSSHDPVSSARAATLTQFTSDVLDIWLPTTNLGIVNLNDGALGLIGCVVIPAQPCEAFSIAYRFVTSIVALRKQWESAGKK
jgi:hypothetical protein